MSRYRRIISPFAKNCCFNNRRSRISSNTVIYTAQLRLGPCTKPLCFSPYLRSVACSWESLAGACTLFAKEFQLGQQRWTKTTELEILYSMRACFERATTYIWRMHFTCNPDAGKKRVFATSWLTAVATHDMNGWWEITARKVVVFAELLDIMMHL